MQLLLELSEKAFFESNFERTYASFFKSPKSRKLGRLIEFEGFSSR